MKGSNEQITTILQRSGLLRNSPDQRIFHNRSEGPIKVLARLDLINELEAIRKVAESLCVPYLTLDRTDDFTRYELELFVKQLDANMLWKHRMIPLYEHNGEVLAAFANPCDHEGIKLLEFSLGKPIRVVISEEANILGLLADYFPASSVKFDDIEDLNSGEEVEICADHDLEQNLDATDASAPPIVKLVNKIIADAIREKASDIHLEPTSYGLEVRYRVDGVLHNTFEIPKRLTQNVLARVKIISDLDIAERRRPQDGRLRVRILDEKVDLRVSTIPTPYGEKIVLRLLRSDPASMKFQNLAMPSEIERSIKQALGHYGKMLLVTGPTGSGKTTTLYTFLNYLVDGTNNITTVEDPIEYRIPGISQMQVNEGVQLNFASALRSILRQDPDVIMIGEIRDLETATIAVQAAQTGHLVMSTLHTNDAPSAITRLIDLGLEPFSVAASVAGVLAQRLVRKLCPDCAVPESTDYLEKHAEQIAHLGLSGVPLKRGVGCDRCRYAGYRGRLGIYSFFEVNDCIAELIHRNVSLQALEQEAAKHGYKALNSSSAELVREGVTTLDEIRPYLDERTSSTK